MIWRVYRAGAHLKRIRDNAERRSIGFQLVEQLQLFCRQLGRQVDDAGNVRAGPVEIGGKIRCDRGHRRRYRGSTPALTPTDIVRKNSMQPLLTELKARLADLGAAAMSMRPAEFEKFVAEGTAKWAKGDPHGERQCGLIRECGLVISAELRTPTACPAHRRRGR
jgi:hypothetical protein